MSKTRQRQIRSLAVNYSAGHNVDWHVHDWHQLMFAVSGVVCVSTRDRYWIVPPNRAIWIPRNTEHSARMVGSVAMRTLYFLPRMKVLGNDCLAVNVAPLMRELMVHVCTLGIVREDTADSRALIQVLISQAKRMGKAPLSLRMPCDPRAVLIANQILEVPSADLAQLVSRFDIGLRTVQRLFKDETGLPLGSWRRQARLLSALVLLSSGRSVTNVSLDVGFDSVSAFISVFRKQFGATPAKFR